MDPHIPVMLGESVSIFDGLNIDYFFDGTLGAGGFARALLGRHSEVITYCGVDRDQNALNISKKRLGSCFCDKVRFIHGNFDGVEDYCRELGISGFGGMFFDIGVSSMQLNDSERGFSFMSDGRLDMRMDSSSGISACDLVNYLSEKELGMVFREYGGEPMWRAVAREVVKAREHRKILSTLDLASVISRAIKKGRRRKIHPATLSFQGLRIFVNDEFGSLARGIKAGIKMLVPGGAIGVLSFHSGEDRIVKRIFMEYEACGILKLFSKKPLRPDINEISANPKARSAKFRAGIKLPLPSPS